jgi:hypothetical protein
MPEGVHLDVRRDILRDKIENSFLPFVLVKRVAWIK